MPIESSNVSAALRLAWMQVDRKKALKLEVQQLPKLLEALQEALNNQLPVSTDVKERIARYVELNPHKLVTRTEVEPLIKKLLGASLADVLSGKLDTSSSASSSIEVSEVSDASFRSFDQLEPLETSTPVRVRRQVAQKVHLQQNDEHLNYLEDMLQEKQKAIEKLTHEVQSFKAQNKSLNDRYDESQLQLSAMEEQLATAKEAPPKRVSSWSPRQRYPLARDASPKGASSLGTKVTFPDDSAIDFPETPKSISRTRNSSNIKSHVLDDFSNDRVGTPSEKQQDIHRESTASPRTIHPLSDLFINDSQAAHDFVATIRRLEEENETLKRKNKLLEQDGDAYLKKLVDTQKQLMTLRQTTMEPEEVDRLVATLETQKEDLQEFTKYHGYSSNLTIAKKGFFYSTIVQWVVGFLCFAALVSIELDNLIIWLIPHVFGPPVVPS